MIGNLKEIIDEETTEAVNRFNASVEKEYTRDLGSILRKLLEMPEDLDEETIISIMRYYGVKPEDLR